MLTQNLINIRYAVINIEEITGAPKAFFKEKSIVDFALMKTKIKEKEIMKKAIEIFAYFIVLITAVAGAIFMYHISYQHAFGMK